MRGDVIYMKLRDRFIIFMHGRYGPDKFSKFLIIAGLIFVILSRITTWYFLYILAFLMLIYSYIRVFSKNINKRYEQNQKYLYYESKVKKLFSGVKYNFKKRKTHRIFMCPSCKQKIRVPRGKGKIEITCPKCHTTFIRKS